MVKNFYGNSTKNARIKIDYSGKKPNVKFSYPSKQYGFQGSMFPYLLFIWTIPCFIFWAATTSNLDQYNKTELQSFTECALENYEQNYSTLRFDLCKPEITPKETLKHSGLFALKLLALLFLPPLLIFLPFKKFWKNVYPKWQGFIARKKFMSFKPNDVKHNQDYGYYCEIPVFSNVILKYDATKDFSKQLKFFEIEEYKFKYYKGKPKKKLSKSGKKDRREKMLNEWIWYARFYFKEKPKSGKLEVLFK